MEIHQLVYVEWLSQEREKYIWQDVYEHSWDEIIGRVYLLKAHESVEQSRYQDALADFEQALLLLAKDGVRRSYYAHALADKALAQCFLAQYDAALATIDQALAVADEPHGWNDWNDCDRDLMRNNRCAILVLAGAFSEALNMLCAELEQDPENSYHSYLRFTLATCLLQLERYHEAVVAYEQAVAEESWLKVDAGLTVALTAARQGQQPDWANLSSN